MHFIFPIRNKLCVVFSYWFVVYAQFRFIAIENIRTSQSQINFFLLCSQNETMIKCSTYFTFLFIYLFFVCVFLAHIKPFGGLISVLITVVARYMLKTQRTSELLLLLLCVSVIFGCFVIGKRKACVANHVYVLMKIIQIN